MSTKRAWSASIQYCQHSINWSTGKGVNVVEVHLTIGGDHSQSGREVDVELTPKQARRIARELLEKADSADESIEKMRERESLAACRQTEDGK